MDGKVNRTRMGRFIELKDQYGITQLVAPVDVNYHFPKFLFFLTKKLIMYVSLCLNYEEYKCV